MANCTMQVSAPSHANNNAIAQPKFSVKSELLDLLSTVGAKGENFLVSELRIFLRDYIKSKQLFDPQNPMNINAECDPLGTVFGQGKFQIPWAMKRLYSFLIPIPKPLQSNKQSNCSGEDGLSMPSSSSSIENKRKADNDDSEVGGGGKRQQCHSPPYRFHLLLPPASDSDKETVYSYQGYETAFAKDSSDETYYENDDDYNDGDYMFSDYESGYVFEEDSSVNSQDFEYEVMSLPSVPNSDSEASTHDVVAEIFVHDLETDVEFWADSSNCEEEETSDDPDITDSDKWLCKSCNSLNKPAIRYCERCWQLRHNWLPDERRRPPKHLRRKRRREEVRRKRKQQAKKKSSRLSFTLDKENEDVEMLGQTQNDKVEATAMSSQATTSSDLSLSESPKCLFCLSKPSDGCIVHGSTGHMIGCYSCLKKLKKNCQPCPICRGPIHKVIRVFKSPS